MTSIITPSPRNRLSVYREIRKSVCERHAEERKTAGLFGRVRLSFRIERETEAEIKKRYPSGAMYGVVSAK